MTKQRGEYEMTKKQEIYNKLVELGGSERHWISRADLVGALGWGKSVSPLLNRLVAERKVEQSDWAGAGVGGRECSGFRPALQKPAARPAVREAVAELDEIRSRLDAVMRILSRVA